ncbi:MAG TPA: DUF5335 family protein [Solirubrobacteraceae bacterium]|nr:DUF5335 family protein [Solirubrobacteraceae bacterium]
MSVEIEIPKRQWQAYFDRISHDLDSAGLSIEVVDEEWPPLLEAERLALQFMAYDAREDLFEVAGKVTAAPVSQILHHVVGEPQRVTADRPTPTQTRIEIDGRDGTRTVIKLEREPVS